MSLLQLFPSEMIDRSMPLCRAWTLLVRSLFLRSGSSSKGWPCFYLLLLMLEVAETLLSFIPSPNLSYLLVLALPSCVLLPQGWMMLRFFEKDILLGMIVISSTSSPETTELGSQENAIIEEIQPFLLIFDPSMALSTDLGLITDISFILYNLKSEKQAPQEDQSFFVISSSKTLIKSFAILFNWANAIIQSYISIKAMAQIITRLERLLPRKKIDIFGVDSLMNSPAPYFILAVISGIPLFSEQFNPFLYIGIIYSGFPILDELFSLDSRNPTPKERLKLQQKDPYFRMALYAAMIVSWIINYRILSKTQDLQISISNLPFIIGLIYISGSLFSAQFAVAHEIMHKPGKFYRVLGTLHMLNLYYMHFTYHHLYRHHHEVATPKDPSTSKKGENVYEFIRRCIVDSWKGVYEDEKRLGKSFITNYAVLSILASVVYAIMAYLIFGLKPLVIYSLVAFFAVFYLQAINYIEHYGLSRKLLPNGEYEKVTILHSWNAPHRFTNYLLFKLQRHSDHHQNSSKPYQTLVSMDESPFLPHGYNLMILMSFFPKTWFRIMDPLVDAYQSLDLEKKEKIIPAVKEKAVTETRKFLVEIALSAILLFSLSMSKVI